MLQVRFKPLGHARFRSNPEYQISAFDRLDADERFALADIERDTGAYGVLRPRNASMSYKSVSHDAALLFFTLQTPGPVPAYFRRIMGDRAEAIVAEQVLDGVLQIEHDGAFVSGPAAYRAVCDEPETQQRMMVDQLALDALRYGHALQLNDPMKLSARIYMYNRAPATPRLRRLLPTAHAVASYVGFDETSRTRRGLDRTFHFEEPQVGLEGWQMWRLRGQQGSERLAYKLYVCPRVDALPRAFAATASVFGRHRVARFKIGNDLHGLLRPDKLVAYLPDAERVMEVAQALCEELDGAPAQVVPFTAGIGASGLISWGMDPPRQGQVFAWQERTSWRLWLTNQLARALIEARDKGGDLEPTRYALDRIQLDGVDPTTWTPRHSLWQIGAGEAS